MTESTNRDIIYQGNSIISVENLPDYATPIQTDLDSITSASQLLSAETDLEQLLAKMMNLVMHNSGAERAVLLLRQESDWLVQARSYTEALEYDVLLNMPFDPANSDEEGIIIPVPVFDYCRRTKEVLVVEDAQLDHRFAKDRMIQKHNIRSIACIPALSRGQLKVMLYLENRQMTDVFSLDRVDFLEHLSDHFAISLENALLYNSLYQKVRELEESESELARHRDHLEATVAERTHELGERVPNARSASGDAAHHNKVRPPGCASTSKRTMSATLSRRSTNTIGRGRATRIGEAVTDSEPPVLQGLAVLRLESAPAAGQRRLVFAPIPGLHAPARRG